MRIYSKGEGGCVRVQIASDVDKRKWLREINEMTQKLVRRKMQIFEEKSTEENKKVINIMF